MKRLPNGLHVHVRRTFPSGALDLSTMDIRDAYGPARIVKTYMGYTQREAESLFRAELRERIEAGELRPAL